MPNYRSDYDNEFSYQVRDEQSIEAHHSAYGVSPSKVRRSSDTPDTYDFLATNRLEVRSGGIYNGDHTFIGGTVEIVEGLLAPGLVADWQDYTPTWDVTSGTSPTLGNGTITGRYVQIGKMVIFTIRLVAGSTTTFGSGTYTFTTPVTLTDANQTGIGYFRDSSSASRYPCSVQCSNTTEVFAQTTHDRLGVTNAQPVSWATSDAINITMTAEAA